MESDIARLEPLIFLKFIYAYLSMKFSKTFLLLNMLLSFLHQLSNLTKYDKRNVLLYFYYLPFTSNQYTSQLFFKKRRVL